MKTPSINPEQQRLENQYAAIRTSPPDQQKTAAELFGPMESWMFGMGEYRLFLNPVTGTWYYYDRPHDDWRDSKFAPETVIFYLDGDNIGVFSLAESGKDQKQPREVLQARGKNFCGKCGAPLVPDKKYCSNCGNKLS
jgi:hypothetical protein